MPISEIDGCPESHWIRVREIVEEALAPTFDVRMVSDAVDAGVIQADIVKCLATDPVVVCDLSGRNPNVMVELGMRLALGKPLVLIKDDRTESIFDVDPLRYVPYRRDLRYDDVNRFKKELKARVKSTWEKGEAGAPSPFIEAFGPIQIPRIDPQEVDAFDVVVSRLERIERSVSSLSAKGSSRTTVEGPPKQGWNLNTRRQRIVLEIEGAIRKGRSRNRLGRTVRQLLNLFGDTATVQVSEALIERVAVEEGLAEDLATMPKED